MDLTTMPYVPSTDSEESNKETPGTLVSRTSLQASQEVSLKDLVAQKSGKLNVTLAEDNKTLVVRKALVFANKGRTRDAYHPTDEELELINEHHSIETLKREQVYVFNVHAAGVNLDRQYEHFTTKALHSLAELFPGKAFLLDHNWKTSGHVGTIFAAIVSKGKLLLKAYILNLPEYQQLLSLIFGGVFNKVSVGFSTSLEMMVCDSCEGKYSIYSRECPHYPGSKDEKGNLVTVTIKDVIDAYETSIVPVPAQREAGIHRSMDAEFDPDALQEFKVLGMKTLKNFYGVGDTVDGAGTVENPDTINSGNRPALLGTEKGDNSVKSQTLTVDQAVQEVAAKEQSEQNEGTVASIDNSTGESGAESQPTADVSIEAEADALAEITASESDAEGVTDEDLAPEDQVTSELSEEGTTSEDDAAGEAAALAVSDSTNEDSINDAVDVLHELKEVISTLQSLISEQKDAAKVWAELAEKRLESLETAQKEQSQRLEVLAQIVELATKTTLEKLVRATEAKSQSTPTKPTEGDSRWVAELSRKLAGGNK